jgi:hypothetical protein
MGRAEFVRALCQSAALRPDPLAQRRVLKAVCAWPPEMAVPRAAASVRRPEKLPLPDPCWV